MLFYVWNDARAWTHWNNTFDMHLRYLGLVSWVSSGLTVGRAAVWWKIDEIDGRYFFFFSFLSYLRAHQITIHCYCFSVLSHIWLFSTPWTAACQVPLSFTISQSFLRLMSFELVMPAVQGNLKSLLQNHNSKASIFWCSGFFMVQISYLYMTTGKTIVLDMWIFVGKVRSLPFNMLSRLVIAFLHHLWWL